MATSGGDSFTRLPAFPLDIHNAVCYIYGITRCVMRCRRSNAPKEANHGNHDHQGCSVGARQRQHELTESIETNVHDVQEAAAKAGDTLVGWLRNCRWRASVWSG